MERAQAKLALYDRLLDDMLDGRPLTPTNATPSGRGAQQLASILNVAVTGLVGVSVKLPSADPVIVYLPPVLLTSALPILLIQ
jgi:hypothetical protein